MSGGADGEVLVGRCFTRVRRHPVMVGRIPGGGRLWGGPYTVAQLAVMVTTFVLLLLTRGVWGPWLGTVGLLVPVVVPYGLGWLVRQVRVDGRPPLAVAGSVLGAVSSPASGRMGGYPVRERFRSRGWLLPVAAAGASSGGADAGAGAVPEVARHEVSGVVAGVPSQAQRLLARRVVGGGR